MADPADERAAYREALARAEGTAVFVHEDGRETPVAPSELPGAVPVQASDQPLPVEPAPADTPTEQPEVPTEVPAVPEAPAPEPTVEELRAELAAAQARVEEQKLMIGRQSSEVGETREQMAALKAQIDAIQAQQAAPPPPPAIPVTQELIDENPERAVQLAYEQAKRYAEATGTPDPAAEHVLQTAFNAWNYEDEGAAKLWLVERKAEHDAAALRAEIAATRQELQQLKEPLTQQSAKSAEQDAWKSAFDEVQKTVPDFLATDASGKSNAVRLLEEVAPKYPAIAQMIADGDVEAKVQGLTLLYEASKLGNPEQVRTELEQAAVAAAAEAAATAGGAAVVSSQATAGQPGAVTKTEEALEQEKYLQRIEGGVSLSKGWTGRS